MSKFLKTIRFDQSDNNVFPIAAKEQEWAISGVFTYFDQTPDGISGKDKQAFANGFLGLTTFGRSTFTCVTNISDDDVTRLEVDLAKSLRDRFGAPDITSAMQVAKEEVAFILDLCKEPQPNTVFAVRRSFKNDGRINEAFHMVRALSDHSNANERIWSLNTDDK